MDQLWLFVPLRQVVANFLRTIPEFPHQPGSSLSVAGISLDLFRRADALQQLNSVVDRLDQLEGHSR
ncbi:hypothetical protein [Shimia abyssi]|uniref:Uncharacterized protein n=1 Tax=Shimia abyssi TaxID=1662395 RepID=A0A2P8F6Y0_9RHOB|nr:hypothetical protein [Shimia abyssi]PSL17466.1 hypothetical protein CLV88_11729 [Shimia abyssi]